jgi:hypothetical protein
VGNAADTVQGYAQCGRVSDRRWAGGVAGRVPIGLTKGLLGRGGLNAGFLNIRHGDGREDKRGGGLRAGSKIRGWLPTSFEVVLFMFHLRFPD